MTWRKETRDYVDNVGVFDGYVDHQGIFESCIIDKRGHNHRFTVQEIGTQPIYVSTMMGIFGARDWDLPSVAHYAARRLPMIAAEIQIANAGDVQAAVCRDFYLAFMNGLIREARPGGWQQRYPQVDLETIDKLLTTLQPVYKAFQ